MFIPACTTLKKAANLDRTSQKLGLVNRQKNYVSHLLNTCRVHTAERTEMHTSEPSVCETALFKVHITVE
jgi:hypothetical protein